MLTLFVVYDHPLDYPRHYVCRVWRCYQGRVLPDPNELLIREELEPIRQFLREMGLHRLPSADPDPHILETWL